MGFQKKLTLQLIFKALLINGAFLLSVGFKNYTAGNQFTKTIVHLL
jgi:hypothetical protein